MRHVSGQSSSFRRRAISSSSFRRSSTESSFSRRAVNQMKSGMGMSSSPPLGGKTFHGHQGGTDGFRTLLLYLPEEKLSVAYPSNEVIYPVQDILRGAVEIYQNKPFEIPTFESMGSSRPVK